MATTTPLTLSSAAAGSYIVINRSNSNPNAKSSSCLASLSSRTTRRAVRVICCQVAVKSNDPTTTVASSDTTGTGTETETETESQVKKIGCRVRVKVPLKVYHVPRVPEIDLTGMEGVVKQYVGVWKGKRISANLPYKIEFFTEIQGRGSVKFFAHLKEDEFDFLD